MEWPGQVSLGMARQGMAGREVLMYTVQDLREYMEQLFIYLVNQEKEEAAKKGEVITDEEAKRRVNAFLDEVIVED